MKITQEDFVARVSPEKLADLMSDWEWLVGSGSKAVMVTALGDAFVRRADDTFAYLNIAYGTLRKVAASADGFGRKLSDAEFINEYFAPHVIGMFYEHGFERLPENHCFSFRILPILGGEADPSNIDVTDVDVHFSLAGQIHFQIKDLVPGTPIIIRGFQGIKQSNGEAGA